MKKRMAMVMVTVGLLASMAGCGGKDMEETV